MSVSGIENSQQETMTERLAAAVYGANGLLLSSGVIACAVYLMFTLISLFALRPSCS